MKTNGRPHATKGQLHLAQATAKVIGGKRVVILEESEYERLRQKADEWEPPLPEPDANGNYPAVEYGYVSLARKIIRDRRRAGWTQAELARRAGLRLATVIRAELGKQLPSAVTIEKIDRALEEVGISDKEVLPVKRK